MDARATKVGKMRVALSILEAELWCEKGEWKELEKAMEVGSLRVNTAETRSCSTATQEVTTARQRHCWRFW